MSVALKICVLALLVAVGHGGSVLSKLSSKPVEWQLKQLECVFNATDSATAKYEEFFTVWKKTQSERNEIIHRLKECINLDDWEKVRGCAAVEYTNGIEIVTRFLSLFKTSSVVNVVEFLVGQAIDALCMPHLKSNYM